MNQQLYVGNLDFKATEDALRDAFGACGTVIEVTVVKDRDTGRPRGFAFVTMSSPEEAQKALATLNGKELAGRAVNVSLARPREPRSGGGGGRRGYGGGRRDRH